MKRFDASKIRQLFAEHRLTDWDAVHKTGLDIGTIKRLQSRNMMRANSWTLQILKMTFGVDESQLLAED